MGKRNNSIPVYGVALCISIGMAALFIAGYIPIGATTIAILLGILISNSISLGEIFEKGLQVTEKQILPFAIALMGVNLNFMVLRGLGYQSILLIIAAMTVTIFSSLLLAKIFKFDTNFALLLGIGNGICGSSAIAATEEIIGAKKENVGLSIAIVNFLGTIGIFLLPIISTAILKFNHINSGMLIGNTLQAIGQVVAAGFSIGEIAGQTATIVKMGRILMLTPVVLILLFVFSKNKLTPGAERKTKKNGVPLFIIGFIFFSLIPTFDLLPKEIIAIIGKISQIALIIAMAGIGLKITFASVMRDGKSALLIGSIIFIIQILFSGSMIFYLK
ncbi:MAG: putative sulfate exporter family transporter [Anaerolineales bacterium]|uniref:Putative sulfate exporter family transporter n=1 Tax=Candidatus Desulfolinea nitratireducens TaxID=2841698 RepID=A0A8J6NNP8_9CHLR|nr:putative sulfate exporter family transporter [Candidatus Desulfolinea nitratireducens]MBL6961631.1 putative sulfate exporter family transporter [Anaerolineales bacterium]